MATHFRRVLAVLMAIGLATGCARVTSHHSFSDHNTITQDTVVAFTPQAAEAIGVDLNDLTAATIVESTAGVMPGVDPSKVTIEDFVDGDLRGIHVVARDLTLDEFNAAASLSAEGVAPGVGTPMSVVREGDTYVVTIPADEARDISGMRGASSVGAIASAVTFELRFTFPGPVKSASVGQVNGKTVVIGLEDLLNPDEIVIRGQATDGIAWGPILRWAGLIGIGIVIVGGATLLVWQDKRRQRITGLDPIPDTDTETATDADTDADAAR